MITIKNIMDSLPFCELYKPNFGLLSEYNSDSYDYELLCKLITDYVSADCWAFTVDDEIIFNNYETKEKICDYLQEQLFRKAIIENVHSNILLNIRKRNKDSIIEIYMFQSTPWKIQITYSSTLDRFMILCFVSREYEKAQT